MRGKETAYEGNAIVGRITPAYAGKSQIFFLGRFCYGDHPRLCGEKPNSPWIDFLSVGSPPPMRGKGIRLVAGSQNAGITPAYAGKSR